MKQFLKIATIAYLGGMVGMWVFILLSLFWEDSILDVLRLVAGVILIPFTPLGLPFFLGACLALTIWRNSGRLSI